MTVSTNVEPFIDTVLCGDSLEILRTLPNESVQMCITSPPYYGLRDYGVSGQIGNEATPQEYVERLVFVFREIKRALKQDGTLWLNIADSYAGSGKGAWSKPIEEQKKNKQTYLYSAMAATTSMPKVWNKIKPKDMIGIPWMVAFALRDDGWYLRSDIIWEKPNCLPEPVNDRPTKSYEHLFLFSKSPHYYYDKEAIMEPIAESTVERYKNSVSPTNKYALSEVGKSQRIFQGRAQTGFGLMRNKRDVWRICTNKSRVNKHFAIFPEKLVEPCILAGSAAGSIVLDPFLGSGTTGLVAKRLHRHYIGIDLNPDYCELAQERISGMEGGAIFDGSKNKP